MLTISVIFYAKPLPTANILISSYFLKPFPYCDGTYNWMQGWGLDFLWHLHTSQEKAYLRSSRLIITPFNVLSRWSCLGRKVCWFFEGSSGWKEVQPFGPQSHQQLVDHFDMFSESPWAQLQKSATQMANLQKSKYFMQKKQKMCKKLPQIASNYTFEKLLTHRI